MLTRLFGIGLPGERADRMAAAEPAVTTAGYSGMTVKAPKPHVALLFLDFPQGRPARNHERRTLVAARDIGAIEQKFKKICFDEKYSNAELEGKFSQREV